MSGWTPGPWKCAVYREGAWLEQAGRGAVAFGFTAEGEPDVADCQLCAAAPELYEALNEAVKDMICTRNSARHAARTDQRWEGVGKILDDRIISCRAALAKARGESDE